MVSFLIPETILFLDSHGVQCWDDFRSNLGLNEIIVAYFTRSLHFLNRPHSGQKYYSKHFTFYRSWVTLFAQRKRQIQTLYKIG
jgi:hypothetical protein